MEGLGVQFAILGQAIVALCVGGVVGWERSTAGKWAGIRTHMLVCLAAMLFVRVAELLLFRERSYFPDGTLRVDPVRMLEAIATGVGFIGAGTILRDRERNVARGLTTAASLLSLVPIGVAVAENQFVLAFGATALVFFVLRGVNWIEIRTHLKEGAPSESNGSGNDPGPRPQHGPQRRGGSRHGWSSQAGGPQDRDRPR